MLNKIITMKKNIERLFVLHFLHFEPEMMKPSTHNEQSGPVLFSRQLEFLPP